MIGPMETLVEGAAPSATLLLRGGCTAAQLLSHFCVSVNNNLMFC